MIEHLAVGGLTGKDVWLRISCSEFYRLVDVFSRRSGGAGSCRRPLALRRRSPLITCHFCHVRFVVTCDGPTALCSRLACVMSQ